MFGGACLIVGALRLEAAPWSALEKPCWLDVDDSSVCLTHSARNAQLVVENEFVLRQLAQAVMALAKDERVTKRGLCITAVDPGWCRTDMGSQYVSARFHAIVALRTCASVRPHTPNRGLGQTQHLQALNLVWSNDACSSSCARDHALHVALGTAGRVI